MPGAPEAVAALRRASIRVGVVSNQSGIGRGLITPEQADAVNAAVDKLTGPFDTWQICPHRPEDGCPCRKPAPGLITSAAGDLGLSAADCVVIGDIGADIAAARAAGARAVLVPTAATLPGERVGVPCAGTITEAVDAVLAGRPIPTWLSPSRRTPRQLIPSGLITSWLIPNQLIPTWLIPTWLITNWLITNWLISNWLIPSREAR